MSFTLDGGILQVSWVLGGHTQEHNLANSNSDSSISENRDSRDNRP